MKPTMIYRKPLSGRDFVLASVCVALVLFMLMVQQSRAEEFGIKPGSFIATAHDPAGNVFTQAGGHPDLTTSFEPTTKIDGRGLEMPVEDFKDVRVDLPMGVVGDTSNIPQCSRVQLANNGGAANCPVASQVGIVRLAIKTGATVPVPVEEFRPIYNLVPEYGQTAALGFRLYRNSIVMEAKVRSASDYGVTATVRNNPGGETVFQATVTLWGVPGAAVHDMERWPKGSTLTIHPFEPLPSPVDPVAFTMNPTQCLAAPAITKIAMNSWQTPERWATDEAASPPATECESLRFDPSASILPDARTTDSPTGLAAEIAFKQPEDPVGRAPAQLRDAEIALPEGLTINPASADGLAACSDVQLGLHSDDPVACPDAAKIGTVTATTPLLTEQLSGDVYIRSQNSDDPESGEMFRVALVLRNEARGLLVKLPGSVTADPATGRLTATFKDNPQVPVSNVSVRLKSGPRAPLATPASCGSKTATAAFTSWGGQNRDLVSPFDIDCSGASGFAPAFKAGSVDSTAGAFSPFTVQIDRRDREGHLSGVKIDMPTGLIAKLKGVELCPDAVAGDGTPGTCPAASRIGTATVGAGAGSPFLLKGPVYLTGPYKGAPYGLSVQVRAAAGPFDLGMVKVRQAINLDPETAQLSVVSDPLPQIVKGVPVRLRIADVKVDRPDFTINPTSCAEKRVEATFTSTTGAVHTTGSKFRVADCATLGFTPKLALRLTGSGRAKAGRQVTAKSLGLTDGGHPDLTAHVTMPAGGANLSSAKVSLPLSMALDPDNANGLCEPSAAAQNTCPKASIVGQVKAISPILDGTLDGPVYFVRGERKDPKTGRTIKSLPTLFIPLTSSTNPSLVIYLKAVSDVQDERLVTTFSNIPDAPVTDFTLKINGGAHGILVVSGANACAADQVADQQYVGQNGKVVQAATTMSSNCPLAVLSSSHAAGALRVKVGGLSAGRVSVSGKGVTKASRTISAATVATLVLPLKRSVKTALAHGHNVSIRATVAFTPKGAKKAKRVNQFVLIHTNK